MATRYEYDVRESVVSLSEVLEVTATTPRCGVRFLNLSFNAREGGTLSPVGPGVYGLFFTPPDGEGERLIYVGMYRGRSTDPFGGHVVRDRWWTHAASVTMRGHRISIARLTSRQLAAHPNTSSSYDFRHLANPANPGCLHRDNGCAAGRNRVFFAESHWDLFGAADEGNILAPFRMAYFRLGSNLSGMDIGTLRARIERIENQLIANFLPVCNDETTWGTARDDVTRDLFQHEARRLLCDLCHPFR